MYQASITLPGPSLRVVRVTMRRALRPKNCSHPKISKRRPQILDSRFRLPPILPA